MMLEEEGSAAAAVPRAQANAARLYARARSPPSGRLEGPAQATARPFPAAASPPARGQGGREMVAFGRGKHAQSQTDPEGKKGEPGWRGTDAHQIGDSPVLDRGQCEDRWICV